VERVMRVRDHIALSTAGAALLRPLLGAGVLDLWAGSVLIDADHYLWYCLQEHRPSPLAAMRFFGGADPPQHRATRVLHSPVAVAVALLLSLRRRRLLGFAVGMAIHVALDEVHDARMDQARARALERDRFSCQGCGTRAEEIGTHLMRQPWLLPSYAAQNLTSLCGECHAAAHAGARA
jgi:hypothetical protein